MGESLRSDHRHGFDQPDEENGDTGAGAAVDRVRDQTAPFCGPTAASSSAVSVSSPRWVPAATSSGPRCHC